MCNHSNSTTNNSNINCVAIMFCGREMRVNVVFYFCTTDGALYMYMSIHLSLSLSLSLSLYTYIYIYIYTYIYIYI